MRETMAWDKKEKDKKKKERKKEKDLIKIYL